MGAPLKDFAPTHAPLKTLVVTSLELSHFCLPCNFKETLLHVCYDGLSSVQFEDEALRIVSYIGLAISLACLLLTILFFLSFGYCNQYKQHQCVPEGVQACVYIYSTVGLKQLYILRTQTFKVACFSREYITTYFFNSHLKQLHFVLYDCILCVKIHRKKLFSAVHNFVHLNLAIALFCGYLVFAVGVELANHEKVQHTHMQYNTYMYIHIDTQQPNSYT